MYMTKTEYKNIGETLYSGTLPNGLRILVIPKPGFSSFYAVYGTNYGGAMRRFKIGGRLKDTPAGVAHFLEHKMFDMPDEVNALSVFSQNGADPNAFTSSSNTCYFFHCTEGFEDNLRLLLRFVSTPWFTPETVQKEQGIIGQEIMMGEDSPGSVVYYNLLNLLYEHHPIRDKVAGTIESIAEITDRTLYDCHKVFYAPGNMVLVVEGDVDPEKVYSIAREVLPPEKSAVPGADFGAPDTANPGNQKIEVEMPVASPQILVGCTNAKMVKEPGLDDLRERTVSMIALRLFAGPSTAFFSRLYSEGLVTNSIDADCDYSAGTSTVMFSAEGPDPDRFFSELLEEADRIAKKGFDSKLFERTLKYSIGSQLRGYEDFDEVCVNACIGLLDGHNIFDSYDLLESITKKDCEDWIAANIRPERMAMSVVRPMKG